MRGNPSSSQPRSQRPKRPLRSSEPMLLTEKQAAKILGFSPRTLQKWRGRGDGPAFLKISSRGAVRYRRSDLEDWVANRLRRSTSDVGPRFEQR